MAITAVKTGCRLVSAGEPATQPGERWEHELVQRLHRRDEAAFAALYDQYASAVHGLARTILRDPALAQEAMHDVFPRLWQRPETYDASRGPFAPWLLRVTRNRSIDLLRRQHEQPFAGEDAEAIGLWGHEPEGDRGAPAPPAWHGGIANPVGHAPVGGPPWRRRPGRSGL